MRESAPLILHEATGSYLVSRYEDVERVFKDKAQELTTENYDWQLEPVHGRTILQLSGREHAVRRAWSLRPSTAGTPRSSPSWATGRSHRHLPHRFGQPGRVPLRGPGPIRPVPPGPDQHHRLSAAADHLAFALGRHFSVGALLARAEVETGVNQLLDAMPGLRLADGFSPVEQGVFTRGPASLPVRFDPVTT